MKVWDVVPKNIGPTSFSTDRACWASEPGKQLKQRRNVYIYMHEFASVAWYAFGKKTTKYCIIFIPTCVLAVISDFS